VRVMADPSVPLGVGRPSLSSPRGQGRDQHSVARKGRRVGPCLSSKRMISSSESVAVRRSPFRRTYGLHTPERDDDPAKGLGRKNCPNGKIPRPVGRGIEGTMTASAALANWITPAFTTLQALWARRDMAGKGKRFKRWIISFSCASVPRRGATDRVPAAPLATSQ
jgi:hypothetical protein